MKYTWDIKEADIVIFDTCSVRQKSEDKITWKLKEISKNQKVRITWCMIQHNLRNNKINNNSKFKLGNFSWSLKTQNPQIIWLTTQEINNNSKSSTQDSKLVWINHSFNPVFHRLKQKRDNIELFFRIDDIWFLPIILNKIWYKIKYDQEIINEYEKIIPEWINTSMNQHKTTAYIPISTWCNQFCAYCIVPYARWLERNFELKQIVQEAKLHIKNWAKEIVLIWQIVNKHPNFVQIIKEILKIKWLKRLRYTSPYPTFYSQELLDLHEKEKKLCPHIHIPVQSWSNKILKKMFRGYSLEEFKKFIDNINKLKRKISITTDIILWFPWETQKDFKETLDLVKYCKFDMIYMWIYSNRPWTLADKKYPDTIPYKTKHKRRSELNKLLWKISLENNKKEIWSIKEVLVNKIISNSKLWILNYELVWYTDNMKQIIIKTDKKNILRLQIWDFIKVRITDWKIFKLYWKLVNKK